jgi:hypothetical protein
MNVVNSSAWLEYFADGANSRRFSAAIENTDELIVPGNCANATGAGCGFGFTACPECRQAFR